MKNTMEELRKVIGAWWGSGALPHGIGDHVSPYSLIPGCWHCRRCLPYIHACSKAVHHLFSLSVPALSSFQLSYSDKGVLYLSFPLCDQWRQTVVFLFCWPTILFILILPLPLCLSFFAVYSILNTILQNHFSTASVSSVIVHVSRPYIRTGSI